MSKLLAKRIVFLRAQELCERRGGRSGDPVPNSPHGLCERKSAFEEAEGKRRIVVVFRN